MLSNTTRLRLELLHDALDLVEVPIDLDLLRRIVLQADHATVDLGLEIDPDRRRVAQDLRHLLVKAEHQAPLAASCALRHELAAP